MRCQVRVLRVTAAAANQKSGVALLVKNYEFLEESTRRAPEEAPEHLEDEHMYASTAHEWTGSLR